MKKIIYLLGILCLTLGSYAQQVTTISQQIDASGGISIDKYGKVFVSNYGASLHNANGNQIHKFDKNHNRTIYATGLAGASGNHFGPDGYLYQSNTAGNRISKIAPNGMVSHFYNTGLSNPVGVFVSDSGDVFVANCGNNTIRRINALGSTSNEYASGWQFQCPNGITMDTSGNLYVTNFNDGNIIKVDTSGNPSIFVTLPGSNNGHITYSKATNYLYATSHGSSQVFKIGLNGAYSIVAGSGVRGNDDGPGSQATFSRPNGIEATKTGDTLYVNSSIPTTDVGFPLNPSVVRMITGVNAVLVNDLDAPLGIEAEFDVYPNPSSGPININISSVEEGTQLSLANPLMQTLAYIPLESGSQIKTQFSIPEALPPGIYYLVLKSKDRTSVRKVLKE